MILSRSKQLRMTGSALHRGSAPATTVRVEPSNHRHARPVHSTSGEDPADPPPILIGETMETRAI